MIRKDIINVVGDMECFIDRLLAHTKEENCQHSVSDFLQEYFDNKNKKKNEDERRAASKVCKHEPTRLQQPQPARKEKMTTIDS